MNRKEISFYGETYSKGCPACNRVENQSRGLDIVFEDNYFRVHQDYVLPIPAMMVIESKRHVSSILDFSKEELNSLTSIILETRKALKEIGIEEANLVQEEKSSHYHIWWMPIYPWMKDITKGKTRNTQTIFNYAKTNLINDKEIKKVEEATDKIKTYFK